MHGGKNAFEKVVLAQAHATFKEHGAEAGAQLLAKHGLIDTAIDYAVEHSNFQHAFELANLSAKHKLPDIHLKKARMHQFSFLFLFFIFIIFQRFSWCSMGFDSCRGRMWQALALEDDEQPLATGGNIS